MKRSKNTRKIKKQQLFGSGKIVKNNINGSWTRPFFTIAPMAGVTDYAFREMFAKYGKPDIIWTEFVSADGLCSKGFSNLIIDLKFSKKQKPIIAQLFSSNPEKMRLASGMIEKMGFDGVDINMGCPDKSIEKSGAGATLIKNRKLALDILEGARMGVKNIPVSIKTRIGYNKIELDWIEFLLNQKLPALTVHLRTRKELSLVPAHWDLMPEIVKMRNVISPDTLIIGNGDVLSVKDGIEKAKKYGCDGIMVGRGIFGNPKFFELNNDLKTGEDDEGFDKTRIKFLIEHIKIFKKELGKVKNFDIMKKHFKAYLSGWRGAKELRNKLMELKTAEEVIFELNNFLVK